MLIILAELDSIEGEENEFSERGLMMTSDFDDELVIRILMILTTTVVGVIALMMMLTAEGC